ncbi:MAG: DUF1223 domain-containing protein [Hyphomicrobiaceae bacterium]
MRALFDWSIFVALAAASAGALAVGSASTANAGKASNTAATPVTVIELFTSQGCSSCPTADALLESYADRPDVVALTLPVDYWDYLGWKDTLASPKFSARQRTYAKARGDGRVYTPQVVINGLQHAVGSSATDIDRAIAYTKPKIEAARVGVAVKSANDHVVIQVDAAPDAAKATEATIWLALISRKVEVKINRGENHGRTIVYHNVVREWMPVGMWNGSAATIKLAHHAIKQSAADGCAIIVQHGDAGPIIGAAMLEHW